MSGTPVGFPDVLLPVVPADLSAAEGALIAAPELARFWQALAEHVPELVAQSWNPRDAAAVLAGAVLTPLAMGYDARGTLAAKVRDGVNKDRRAKAAELAHELAGLLDTIWHEPLPPGAVVAVTTMLDKRLIAPDAPSYLMQEPTAEILRRLADALTVPPDYSTVPGLASQKPSWRGFIREVCSNLDEYGFALRERDAVALAAVICSDVGVMNPSRDAVRDALRWGDSEPETTGK